MALSQSWSRPQPWAQTQQQPWPQTHIWPQLWPQPQPQPPLQMHKVTSGFFGQFPKPPQPRGPSYSKAKWIICSSFQTSCPRGGRATPCFRNPQDSLLTFALGFIAGAGDLLQSWFHVCVGTSSRSEIQLWLLSQCYRTSSPSNSKHIFTLQAVCTVARETTSTCATTSVLSFFSCPWTLKG